MLLLFNFAEPLLLGFAHSISFDYRLIMNCYTFGALVKRPEKTKYLDIIQIERIF